jgi:phosphoribosylanthranilate isomerase
MTLVKICGITNLEDARLAVKCGADAIGFNFFPGSKRYIDEGYVESIVERLQNPITKVGVFVNQPIEEIIETEGIAELDVIQLHGEEPPEFINDLKSMSDAKIIKAFRVNSDFAPEIIDKYDVDAVMLDAYSKNEHGGTGRVFDWQIAAGLAPFIDQMYLAGGLNANNVADAIRIVKPFAVDVASGVESAPGKKDPKKLEAFIRNAKSV